MLRSSSATGTLLLLSLKCRCRLLFRRSSEQAFFASRKPRRTVRDSSYVSNERTRVQWGGLRASSTRLGTNLPDEYPTRRSRLTKRARSRLQNSSDSKNTNPVLTSPLCHRRHLSLSTTRGLAPPSRRSPKPGSYTREKSGPGTAFASPAASAPVLGDEEWHGFGSSGRGVGAARLSASPSSSSRLRASSVASGTSRAVTGVLA